MFIFSRWRFKSDDMDAMIRVKASHRIVNLFIKIKLLFGGNTSLSFIKTLITLFASLRAIQSRSGSKGLVLYLKACAVALQQAASGHKLKDLTPLKVRISRTKGSKLPRIIPSVHRRIIITRAAGWQIYIKLYLTIFYVYRLLSFTPKETIDTIIEKGKDFSMAFFDNYMFMFLELFIFRRNPWLRFQTKTVLRRLAKTFQIVRSSPSSNEFTWSTHPASLIRSAWALKGSPVWDVFRDLCYHMNLIVGSTVSVIPGQTQEPIGKLGFKEEAAGKLRVFAMVDPYTQWLLYPLHKLIFSILRKIPMDGTFNQLEPVRKLLGLKCKELYSLDLSAATDRLPVTIQARLLTRWIDVPEGIPDFGEKWMTLLVGREYAYKFPFSNKKGLVKYAVGQPMGALSSWAMLALTHHFILQCAAWEVGYTRWKLYTRYAILGDDIVIGDRDVALSYLSILKRIGVSVGLAKSILSRNGSGLEFAKRTFIDGVDVSPLSLKELSDALSNASAWAAFAAKFKLPFAFQAKWLGFGYRTEKLIFSKLNHALKVLWLCQIPKLSLTSQYLNLGQKVPKDLEPLLPMFLKTVLRPATKQINVDIKRTAIFLASISLRNIPAGALDDLDRDLFRMHGRDKLSEILRNPTEDLFYEQFITVGEHSPVEMQLMKAFHVVSNTLWSSELPKVNEFCKTLYEFEKRLWVCRTMDEAFLLLMDLQNLKSMIDLAGLRLEIVPKAKNTALPYQARLFRNWSRLTHKLAKAKATEKTNNLPLWFKGFY